MPRKKSAFKFKVNDLVLVKWNDGVFYYGKVSKISIKNKKCTVVFDDRSKENVKFSQVFDVNATTTEVEFCMKCKQGTSSPDDELVFCDSCNTCYHQKCHVPAIPDEVLDPSEEWVCTYCEQEIPCPYVVNQDEVVSVLYTSPERKRSKVSNNEEEEESLKQKKRKLAALSPPRCSNGSVSAGDETSKKHMVQKLTLDIDNSASDDIGNSADSVVQIPFSALTPDRFPPSSPLFAAIKNHWEKSGSISTPTESHVSTNGDPMLSSVVGSDIHETTVSHNANDKESRENDPLIPPSPSMSDGDEEFEEITTVGELPEVSQADCNDGQLGESVCVECGKKAGFLCSGCKAAWYCGSECQYRAWPVHINQCINQPQQ
jgi:hypothetical protein